MKRILLSAVALLTVAGIASAATTQKWTAGWDNFGATLNFEKSSVTWSVSSSSTTNKLAVTFKLVGAEPTTLYQVGLNFFCTTFPATFGQFPNAQQGGGACTSITRQGVTASVAAVEVGTVLTDINGSGTFSVVIDPIPSGTYTLEFYARNGAGCNVNNGGCNPSCEVDFQSPGPTFGTATTITVP